MTFYVPPLIVSTAHLLTESPYSMDLAVQFAVIAAVLVIVGDVAGHRTAWWMTAPVVFVSLVGVILHRVGNASLHSNLS